MWKIFDIVLPFNYNLGPCLSRIFGIGLSRAFSILDGFGFAWDFSMNDVNAYIYNILVSYIKPFFILDARLEELCLQRKEFYFENNFVRGIRLFNGLPIRGQRTHTNASTPKRLVPHSDKHNDVISDRNKRLSDFAKKREKKKINENFKNFTKNINCIIFFISFVYYYVTLYYALL